MDLDPIASTVLLIAVLAAELWVILKVTGRPGGVEIQDLAEREFLSSWPRGVQEEDVVPWRLDRLTPRGRPDISEPARQGRAPSERVAASPAAYR